MFSGRNNLNPTLTKLNVSRKEDLTLKKVVAWTKDSLGAEQVEYYEKSVADQIQVQITPTIVTPPLPWL